MTASTLKPIFAEYIPAELETGYLYISMDYATAAHRCACGCGSKVFTPFGPADWQLTFDGSVTLRPSVGNGQLPCQSHYLIQGNRIVWLRPISKDATRVALERDHDDLDTRYKTPIRPNWVRRLFGASGRGGRSNEE